MRAAAAAATTITAPTMPQPTVGESEVPKKVGETVRLIAVLTTYPTESVTWAQIVAEPVDVGVHAITGESVETHPGGRPVHAVEYGATPPVMLMVRSRGWPWESKICDDDGCSVGSAKTATVAFGDVTTKPELSVTWVRTENVPPTVGAQEIVDSFEDAHPLGRPDHAYAKPPVPPLADAVRVSGWPTSSFPASGVTITASTVGSLRTLKVADMLFETRPFESVTVALTVKVPTTPGAHPKAVALPATQPEGRPDHWVDSPPEPPETETESEVVWPRSICAGVIASESIDGVG
jgi:hypothetical protein